MKSEAFNIDCMEYMKQCRDKQFDLAIVDPPYGIEEMTGKNPAAGRGKLKLRVFNREEKKFNAWDKKPSKDYFTELFRVSKNQVVFGGNYFDLPPARCFIVWDKCQPFPSFSACEFAWTSFNTPAKIFRFDNRTSGKIHPTQKPVELYRWLLANFAKSGDSVLDTHLGSGSSRIACYDMGFDFTGTEIDTNYFQAQESRFNEYRQQLSLFEFVGGHIQGELAL
ncbi:DNA methyltransferase [Treponema parvum]|uniref:DNA methyltransferase n=1 Tax=Treponema parvum TaxID=138851 RepID=UPI001AEC2171|nr:DNA methyltransferase [Treponema parvum]QTQ16275.1 site-specific DNA-methyltransferase [Treponema parvum]